MISSKATTKAWGHTPETFKTDNTRYGAANALPEEGASPGAAALGGASNAGGGKDDNIGEVLNRIADPTGADAAKKAQRKPNNTLDKDDFLKLMLAQMKNQDPMNPMQSHEMASQLAQFTSLEQLFNVNKNLEGLTKAQDPQTKFQALNFLGKTVKSDSRQIFKAEGPVASDCHFELMGDAKKVKVTISDETGNAVKTMEIPGMKKGMQKIAWAGLDDDDKPTRAGRYFLNVEAENASGKKIGVQTETKGVISGVNYTPEGPMLLIGNQRVRLQDIQEIEDESLTHKSELAPGQGPVMMPVEGSNTNTSPSSPNSATSGAQAANASPTGQQMSAQAQSTSQKASSAGNGKIDPSQLAKVNKQAEKKIVTSHYNPKASLPMEVDSGGIKTESPFGKVAKGG